MSDVFRQGLELSVIGFAVVFGVLSVMAVVVSLLKRLDDRWQAAEAEQKAAALTREPTIDDVRGDGDAHRRLALGCSALVTLLVIAFWVVRVVWLGAD